MSARTKPKPKDQDAIALCDSLQEQLHTMRETLAAYSTLLKAVAQSHGELAAKLKHLESKITPR